MCSTVTDRILYTAEEKGNSYANTHGETDIMFNSVMAEFIWNIVIVELIFILGINGAQNDESYSNKDCQHDKYRTVISAWKGAKTESEILRRNDQTSKGCREVDENECIKEAVL